MSALRRSRRESGLTQAELAERAGVSRQLVAAVEAGRHVPGVDAALRLAAALGSSVEELFTSGAPPAMAVLDQPLPEGELVRLGRVGERLVASPLPDHGTAGSVWAKPDGVHRGGQVQELPGAAVAGAVVAGCEPAFGLAERMLEGLGPRSLLTVPASTGSALRALARGTVHAAVVHGPPRRLPPPPVVVTRVHVARWRVGLAGPAPNRRPSLEATLDAGRPVVQRDPQAASQQAFERAREALGARRPTPGPVATGHLDAARMASTLGTAAVTTEAAARAFGLAFAALEEHTVELWVDRRWLEQPGVAALVELLGSAAFTDRMAQFGGYDLAACGTVS